MCPSPSQVTASHSHLVLHHHSSTPSLTHIDLAVLNHPSDISWVSTLSFAVLLIQWASSHSFPISGASLVLWSARPKSGMLPSLFWCCLCLVITEKRLLLGKLIVGQGLVVIYATNYELFWMLWLGNSSFMFDLMLLFIEGFLSLSLSLSLSVFISVILQFG